MIVEYASFSDAVLLERAREGDVAAFEALYRRHWAGLLNEAYRRLKVKEEAEEVVQEVFTDLYARLQVLPETQNPAGYLYRAVQYAVYKKIRSFIAARKYEELQSHYFSGLEHSSDALSVYRELEQALARSISKMPEKCRQVFLLSREQGLSYSSIAARLQISESTVEKHIIKALQLLRRDLRHYRYAMVCAVLLLGWK